MPKNTFMLNRSVKPEGEQMDLDDQFPDGMFRFEKVMKGADRA